MTAPYRTRSSLLSILHQQQTYIKIAARQHHVLYGQGPRSNGSQSWEDDVKSYVQCSDNAAEPFHSQRRALSSALLSTSITDFEAAERW